MDENDGSFEENEMLNDEENSSGIVIASPDPTNIFKLRKIITGSGRGPTMAGRTPEQERHTLRVSDDGRTIEHVYTRVNSNRAYESSYKGKAAKREKQKQANRQERIERKIEKKKKKKEEILKLKYIAKGKKEARKEIKILNEKEAKVIVQKKFRIRDRLSDDAMRDYIFRLTNSAYASRDHTSLVAIYDQTAAIAEACPATLIGKNRAKWVKGAFYIYFHSHSYIMS
jgi:hypothetical protein